MKHRSSRRLSIVLLIAMLLQLLAVPAAGVARSRSDEPHGLAERQGADSGVDVPRPFSFEPSLIAPHPLLPSANAISGSRHQVHSDADPLATLTDFASRPDAVLPSLPDPFGDLPAPAQASFGLTASPTQALLNPSDTSSTTIQQPTLAVPVASAANASFKLYLPVVSHISGTSASISPTTGGVLTSPDGAVSIRFAPGAVTAQAVAHYADRMPRNLPPSLESMGHTFDLTVQRAADSALIPMFITQVTTSTVRNTEFNVWQTVYTVTPTVNINLTYTDAAIAGVEERSLQIYRQDAPNGAWQAMPTVVDAEHNRLRAITEQGGRYTLLGRPIARTALLDQTLGVRITGGTSTTQTVVLDPDHGGGDPGGTVTSPASYATLEKNYNLQVALLVQTRLQACGVQVVMTRSSDVGVDHPTRASVINAQNPDAAITLAFNVVNHTMSLYGTGSGPEAWVNLAKPGDNAFGAQVNSRVNEFTGLPNTRGVKDANLNSGGPIYVALHVTPLFSHSELAFMDSYNDRALMDDPAGMGAIADGVFMAIVDALGGSSVCPITPGGFKFPAPLSAAERARLRNLGYKNYTNSRGDPVNTETGNHLQQFTDLNVPGLGSMNLVLQRTYNSLDSRDGRFGPGWSSLLDMNLRLANDDSVDVRYADGSGVYFEADGTGFRAGQPGVFDTLTRNGPDFMLATPNQMFYHFEVSGAEGRLVKISDRHGNTITFKRDADGRVTQIVDSAGRSFDLTYEEGHVKTITDPIGRVLRYAYDGNSDLRSVTDANGGLHSFEYSDHRMTKLIDPEHILYLQNTYDGQGRVIDQIDASGSHNTFDYSVAGQTTFKDNLQHPTTDSFDALSRVTATRDANGESEQFVYDPNYNVISHTDKRGKTWTYTYDAQGNMLTATDPLSHTTSYTYNATNDLTSVTDLGGPHDTPRTTTYTYDGDGNLVRIDRPDGTHISATYDAHGQLRTLSDANTHTTEYIYDGEGNLIEVIDPLLHHTFYRYDAVGRQIKITDANRHVAQFVYDGNDNITRITDPKNQHVDLTYDLNDNLIRMKDRRSGLTTYRYDENLKLIAETDPMGHSTTYDYDLMYNRISATDPLTHTTLYRYDALYRLTEAEDALHGMTSFGYDPNGNVISTTDALSQTTLFDYDALNRLDKQTDALNGVTTFEYDAVGRRTTMVNPRTARTEYGYDLLDRPVLVRDALNGGQHIGYDFAGNLISITDANQHTTTRRYDADDRLIEQRDPLRHPTYLGYDAVGNTTVMTNALGYATHYTYDPNDNLHTIVDALSGMTTLEYDAEDALIARTDANHHTTRFAYDLDGLLIRLTEAGGQLTRYTYDAAHNLVTRTSAKGNTWTYIYDALNRRTSETDPLHHTTGYGYDALGRQSSMTDANGVVTGYGYDALGRLTSVVQNRTTAPADAQTNITTGYGYDAVGNLTRISDANHNATTFTYDLLDRLTDEVNPLNHTWHYDYDPASNLITRTDAKGQITRYTYDADDLLTHIGYPDSTGVSFGYDAVHNQTTMADALGVTRNQYDALNRLTASTNHISRRVDYTYDPVGNRTSMAYPDGRVLRYEYDSTDFPIRVIDPDGNAFVVSRDATHNITNVRNPNQTVAQYDIDAAERVTAVRNLRDSGDVLNTFAYTLDAVGNRTHTLAQYGAGKPTQLATSYQYDPLSRLTRSDESEGHFNEYAFDAAGNRTRLTTNYDPTRDQQIGVATTTYSYDAANELVSASLSAGGAPLVTQYDYDQNGNRIRCTAPDPVTGNPGDQLKTEYAYDFENRLTHTQDFRSPHGSAWLPGDETRLTYDGYGRLFRRLHDQHIGSGGQQWVDYVYDGLDPIAEYVTPSPQYVNYYRGLGRILSAHEFKSQQSPAGTIAYYHYDGLGSVTAMTKQQGQSDHDYRYGDYGTILDNNGHAADASNFTDPHNHYTYTGQEWDEQTELMHFYAREYDPATGTWLQQDPYRGQLRAPATLHRYGYVGGNPTNWSDVFGFSTSSDVLNAADNLKTLHENLEKTRSTISGVENDMMLSFNYLYKISYQIENVGLLCRIFYCSELAKLEFQEKQQVSKIKSLSSQLGQLKDKEKSILESINSSGSKFNQTFEKKAKATQGQNGRCAAYVSDVYQGVYNEYYKGSTTWKRGDARDFPDFFKNNGQMVWSNNGSGLQNRKDNKSWKSILQPGDVLMITPEDVTYGGAAREYGHIFIYLGNGKFADSGEIHETYNWPSGKDIIISYVARPIPK